MGCGSSVEGGPPPEKTTSAPTAKEDAKSTGSAESKSSPRTASGSAGSSSAAAAAPSSGSSEKPSASASQPSSTSASSASLPVVVTSEPDDGAPRGTDVSEISLESMFQNFDTDRSGFIDKEEFRALLRAVAGVFELVEPTQSDVDIFFKNSDKNSDGRLDYEEFSKFVTEMREQKRQISELFQKSADPATNTVPKERFGGLIDSLVAALKYAEPTPMQMEAFLRDKQNVEYPDFIKFVKMLYLLSRLEL